MTTDEQWKNGKWVVVGETVTVWGTNVPDPDPKPVCCMCGRSLVGVPQGWAEDDLCSGKCWAELHGEP